MKKQLTVLGISILIITGAAFTAYAQQKENKGNNKEPKDNGKNKHKGNQGKDGNNGKNPKDVFWDKKNQGDKKSDLKNNNGNKGNSGNRNDFDKGKGNRNKIKKHDIENYYSWNDQTFKDRKKLRNTEKVTVCHKVNGNNPVAISVSKNALQAHLNHGDVTGECAVIPNNSYSDIFLKRRVDYYNTIQNSYEQVSYSQSILDYALARLTNSRQQLVVLQNNNMPVAEIERKQATVVELEENVSLLETLIGVAANLVVNKLQQ